MLYLGWLFGGTVGGVVGGYAGWCAGQMVVSKIVFAYLRRSMERDS